MISQKLLEKRVLEVIRKVLLPYGFQYSELNGWRYGTTPVVERHVDLSAHIKYLEWLVLRNATTLQACLIIRIKPGRGGAGEYHYELLWEPSVLLLNTDSTIAMWTDRRTVAGDITI